MTKPIILQTLGWTSVIPVTEQASDFPRGMPAYFPDADDVESLADPLYDKWRSNYTRTCNCSEQDMMLAFELGCQAAFEHGQSARTEVNEICQEILEEYQVKINKGTIDAFRGGVDAILLQRKSSKDK